MAPVLSPGSSSPPKASLSSPINSIPDSAPHPLSSRPPSPPLIKSPRPFPARSVVGILPPPSIAAHLSESDYPTIQAPRSPASKSRLPAAAGVTHVRGLGVFPPSPSPPDFQSSYVISQFQFELPDSNSGIDVSSGRMDSSSPQSVKLDCEDSVLGPLGPVPPLDDSLLGGLGSSGICAAGVGAFPLSRPCSPCLDPGIPSDGLPGVPFESANFSASSTRITGPSDVIDP